MINGIQDIRRIYGSVFQIIIMVCLHGQRVEDRLQLSIMKHVSIKKMLGRENYFLNREWVSVMSKIDLNASYL